MCVLDKRLSFFTFVCSRTLKGNSVHHTLEKKHIYRVLNRVYNLVLIINGVLQQDRLHLHKTV